MRILHLLARPALAIIGVALGVATSNWLFGTTVGAVAAVAVAVVALAAVVTIVKAGDTPG